MIGTRLTHYEITSHLGSGGMGDVYQATDSKLGRSVAIKLLPEAFSHDNDRVARFEREARVLASLNHPNIAAIHGLEESGGRKFLVMELVDGETLAELIKRGPIPIDEVLPLAKQIIDGLESAHEKGIMHRDLKPANIKITPQGQVKVLDFGLAKAFAEQAADVNLSNSPTLSMAGTNAGLILGTAAYMSPEQAKGLAADARSDVFSFGCVLYEMLTGRQAFHGETVSEVLASVLVRDPDYTLLPQNLSPRLHELLDRCVNKNPKRRWHAIADLRIELETVAADVYRKPESMQPVPASKSHEGLAWAVAGVFAIVLILGLLFTLRMRGQEPLEVRLDITTPSTSDPVSLAISPDGRRVAFVATQQGKSTLFVRDLDSTAIRPVPGTDGAVFPCWSPDGRSIGFFADSKLKRVDIAGGAPQILALAPTPRGCSWSAGTIVFAPTVGPLYRILAAGGERIPITDGEASLNSQRFPQFLPDGQHFFFYGAGSPSVSGVYVGSLDGSTPKRLVSSDTKAVYDSGGFLLFTRQSTLFAESFDLRTLEVHGDPIPVADNIAVDPGIFSSSIASANGAIAYRRGSGAIRQLVWFDHLGNEIAAVGGPDAGGPSIPELSPDERHVAVARTVDGNVDVWTVDMKGVPSRLTSDAAFDIYPSWSPDGQWLAFGSTRKAGIYDLYRKLSVNAGPEELLLESSHNKVPGDWSSDGRFILYREADSSNGYDLWALPTFGDKKPIPIANSRFDEREGQFSADVRWVAYTSNFSDRLEVYVEPFGRPGGKQRISTDGGMQPRWRHDGKEIFYIAPDNTLMSAPIQVSSDGRSLQSGTPVPLFHTDLSSSAYITNQKQQYAVSRDGQRFLMVISPEEAAPSPISVILNWKPPAK